MELEDAQPLRRRADAVALGAQMDGRAELFGSRGVEGLHIARIEPEDMPDHESHAVLLHRRHDAARGGAVMGERLFEKDRLAGLGRGDRRFFMKPIRQADADGIEFRAAPAARADR